MWGISRGAVLTLDQGWRLAQEWFADRLSPQWRTKSVEEAEASFSRIGLRSAFWKMSAH
jgi:hypothetical protein